MYTGWAMRYDLVGESTPHIRWQRSLRQALYAVYPDPMIEVDKIDSSRDDLLCDWLQKVHAVRSVHKGIPAGVYRAAIVDVSRAGAFTMRARPMDIGARSALRSADPTESQRIKEAADKRGRPPEIVAEKIRQRHVFWAGDSGLLIYRRSSVALPTSDMSSVHRWDHLTTCIGSGYSAREWFRGLEIFINSHRHLLERVHTRSSDICVSGDRLSPTNVAITDEVIDRFPPGVRCFVFDNLNGCTDSRARDCGLSIHAHGELCTLFDLMRRYFVAPVYTCSAPASRWGRVVVIRWHV